MENFDPKIIEETEKRQKKTRDELKRLVSENVLPEPRPMTRSERKKLDTAGLNVNKMRNDDQRTFTEVRDAMYDWILDNVYPDGNFDDLGNDVGNAFAAHTYNITFRDTLAEKNL